mgnify:CR=1
MVNVFNTFRRRGPVLSTPAISGSTRLTTGFDTLSRMNGWGVEGLTTNGLYAHF